MKLIFVCNGFYPAEHAAAVRHSTLAKGLVQNGHSVEVLIINAQDWKGQTTMAEDGVTYTELNPYRGNNKLLKHYHLTRSIYKAKKFISDSKKKNEVDAVVILTIEFFCVKAVLKHTHKLGIKVFHERTELPYTLHKPTKKMELMLNAYYKLLPGFDGIFVINDKLDAFIKQFNRQTEKLLTVVDMSFFDTKIPSPYPFPYVGYCGTIGGDKDGVPILVEAFAKIAGRFPDLKLVLVGKNSNKAAIEDTLSAIERFKITDRIVFTGTVDREMMPVILCNAAILVVAKPANEQNSGNFPIKIGEYLATGVPIVVTKVGEIPVFVKDGQSGFLAEPGSADSFAQKMEEALSNKERSATIGQNGKKVAAENFEYKKVAAVMSAYIEKFLHQ